MPLLTVLPHQLLLEKMSMEREEVDCLAKAEDVQVKGTQMAVDLVGEDAAEV